MRASIGFVTLACGTIAAVAACASDAIAQTTPVEVDLSPAVALRATDLGRSEIEAQRLYLQHSVERALGNRASRPASVRLTIEDLVPNRATSVQLGQNPGLSSRSFGLGGAAVTGQVTAPDGRVLAVRYRYFPQSLATEINFTDWGDAEQAFDTVARGIAAGRPPDQTGAWPPPHPPRAVTGSRIPR